MLFGIISVDLSSFRLRSLAASISNNEEFSVAYIFVDAIPLNTEAILYPLVRLYVSFHVVSEIIECVDVYASLSIFLTFKCNSMDIIIAIIRR